MPKCNCENCNCQVDVTNPLRKGICLNCEGGTHINAVDVKQTPKSKRIKVF